MAPLVENHSSSLLTNEENLQLFKLLGNRCQSLCSTVVQLYTTQPPNHSQWIKKATGVLCFVKDNTRKNFFFRFFCLKRNVKLWEQEMYNNMDYLEGTKFFHMFEAKDYLVAFNFADIDEANDLLYVVRQKIHARKRREDKRSRQISQSQTLPSPTSHMQFSANKKTLDPAEKQAKRKRNITKADIGIPSNFVHVSHIGWSSSSGFDINTENEQLRAFFEKAGVSEQQLQDKSTREYIYDFINRNNVREAFVQDSTATDNQPPNVAPPPAVPPRGPLVTRPPHFRNAPPPPIPNKNGHATTPRKPRMEVAPPRKPAPAPSVPTLGVAPAGPPPPPPPPPLPVGGEDVAPPPPPPMALGTPRAVPRGGDVVDLNSALMQSIRNGTTLKSVEETNKTQTPPQEDARSGLLSEIRQGFKLRPVDERDVKGAPSPVPATRCDDLASALARALAKRSEVIHSEDDDDKSNASTDSEWED
ncbi:unnamed protein product [Phaedon cochleariae]|uniref:Neural Wiskott-Aldrich syndrome protein n=1 Tax=Phaedon cochleariae TaxID=80249 RepID=A0A9N9SN87_PHACE|nr:unnamed protein product [Phaedon cochleariae]